MKDEEMAEEIANKRCHEIMCYGHCSFSSPKHHRCGEWHREYNCALDGYHEGFKDCAKSRLNVTTISDCPIKDDWHYVKDGDYPKEKGNYLVAWKRIHYVEEYGEWGFDVDLFNADEGYFEGVGDYVVAWQEIVPPKEIE
jgi:hypothetical protein